MKRRSAPLPQKNDANSAILAQALIESYQVKRSGTCKGGQICVAPDIGRKGASPRVGSPVCFQIDRFRGDDHTRIAKIRIVFPPCLLKRQGFRAHDAKIGCQAQETLLGHAAERAAVIGHIFKPVARRGVMWMRSERQGDPDIDVRQKHLSASSSSSGCRGHSSDLRKLAKSSASKISAMRSLDSRKPPGCLDSTKGSLTRCLFPDLRCKRTPHDTVTGVPSGKATPRSSTITPSRTWPRYSMRQLLAAGASESRRVTCGGIEP